MKIIELKGALRNAFFSYDVVYPGVQMLAVIQAFQGCGRQRCFESAWDPPVIAEPHIRGSSFLF